MPSRGKACTAAEEMIGTRLPQRIAQEKRGSGGVPRAFEVEVHAEDTRASSAQHQPESTYRRLQISK
jgi:hypothetical protein